MPRPAITVFTKPWTEDLGAMADKLAALGVDGVELAVRPGYQVVPETVSRDLPRAAAHAPADARHYVLTYSHALDLEICHAILSRPFAQLGLIGSATKKARFLNRLRDLGHPPDRLARLDCPIGDPALGKQPQAIAVSVIHALLSDLTADRSGTGTGIDRDKKAKGHSG